MSTTPYFIRGDRAKERWHQQLTVEYDAIYTARGPKHWNRHPMSVSTLMQQGVSIPVWKSKRVIELDDHAMEPEQLDFLRSLLSEQG